MRRSKNSSVPLAAAPASAAAAGAEVFYSSEMVFGQISRCQDWVFDFACGIDQGGHSHSI